MLFTFGWVTAATGCSTVWLCRREHLYQGLATWPLWKRVVADLSFTDPSWLLHEGMDLRRWIASLLVT